MKQFHVYMQLHLCQSLKHQIFCVQTLDIDECGEEIDECDNNSECENTVGSYTCTCHPGYSGTGRECCKYPRVEHYLSRV